MFRGLDSVNLIAVIPGVYGSCLPSAFACGLVSSSTPIRLLFLRKTKFPVGHGSHHAILQWKKVMGCFPLAAPGENQHGLNGYSPQCPSRMSFSLVQTAGFRVSAKMRACAEVILGADLPMGRRK